jgi:WD40 repeat protein
LRGHSDKVSSVQVSPDGTRIVSVGHDHKLKLWNAFSGLETLTVKGNHTVIRCVKFSPDGQRIVTGSEDQTLKIWDASAAFQPQP